jgi:glucosyl-dolichyl phosphate glucuronosyltransferase
MKLSVIVCTYNRCESLAKALKSIAESRVPDGVDWEVLVVDNNSTDQTRNVVDDFSRTERGRFRYLFESEQGLSCARNCGIRGSRGQVLAFTDDDAIVEPDWLWNLTAEICKGEWIGSGGRIVPQWPGPVPSWLCVNDADTMGPFVAFDLGSKEAVLRRPPYGANMAFRKDAFERYGYFRSDLGRSGSNLEGREDLEFGNRLLATGERLRYEPDAVVYHPVPESRMRKGYVLRWWYWYGRSEVKDLGPPAARTYVQGVPFFLFHRLLRWALQSVVSRRAQDRFACRRTTCYIAGTIVGCYQRRRSGESAKRLAFEPEKAPQSAVTPK